MPRLTGVVLQQTFLGSQVRGIAGNGSERGGFVGQLGIRVGPVAADEALLQQGAELVFQFGRGQAGFLEQRAERGDEVQFVEQVEFRVSHGIIGREAVMGQM